MSSTLGIENVFSVEELRRARDVVAPELARLVGERSEVVVVSSDMGPAVAEIRQRHPDRYFEFGIAEANAMSVASGLAASGFTPYVMAMGPFCAVKCAEQIRTDIAYNQLPVRIVARLSGVAMGWFGPSHHALEDIAVCRSIPNLAVVAPSDANSTLALMRLTVDATGPVYLRVSAGIDKVVHEDAPELTWGSSVRVREGGDVTIVATGTAVAAALGACELLGASGIEAGVIDALFLDPLDEAAMVEAMQQTGAILTVEEHYRTGGLGSAVADTLMRHGAFGRFATHAFPDEEIMVSTPAALLDHYGISAVGIAQQVRALLSRKELT